MKYTIDQKTEQAAELLKALAHPLRMQLVLLLTQHQPCNVTSLLAHFQVDQSLLAHHLIIMKDKGILTSARKGNQLYYSVAHPNLIHILNLLLKTSQV